MQYYYEKRSPRTPCIKIKRPFLLIAVIGTVITVTVFYFEAAIIFFSVGLIIALSVSIFLKKPRLTFLVFICLIIDVSTCFSLYKISKTNSVSGSIVNEDVIITSIPENNGNQTCAEALCISDNRIMRGEKIKIYYKSDDLSIGDTVNAEIYLSGFSDKKDKMTNYSKGIYSKGTVIGFGKSRTDGGILCFVPKLRRRITEILKSSNLSFNSRSLVSALTVGDKSSLTDVFYSNVKASGVAHLLVVSGMHLVIIMSVFSSGFKFILRNKYIRAAFSLILVFIICAACGFSMSIIRAGITYLLFAAAPLFSRERDSVNSLAAALVMITVISPFAVFSVSLELSLLSTAGILILSPFLCDFICDRHRIRNKFLKSTVSAACVTSSASLMTAPVCIAVFGYLSTVALITNLLVSFAVTAILSLSVAAIFIGLILPNSKLTDLILYPVEILSRYTVEVINRLGSWKFSTVRTSDRLIYLILFTVLLLISLKNLQKIRRNYLNRKNIYF